MDDSPIGVFDSGIGGTSIWKEIQGLLPFEDTIYLADCKNAPYGEKSENEILRLSIKNTDLLLRMGCKMIVVACNTATTNAIDYLRKHYDVPFIGIEPAIKPAALQSKSKSVGILATRGTLSSRLFHSTSENHASGIKIIEQEGRGLVPLIEKGEVGSKEVRKLLETFLEPMLSEGIDYLVLGCTHYPYLIPTLREMMPETVQIIDSGEAVARQTKAILKTSGLLNRPDHSGSYFFYSNASLKTLELLLSDVAVNVKVSYMDF